MTTLKRKRLNKGSPAKTLELPGEIYKHCNEKCNESGEGSKAIQCKLCYSWVHALAMDYVSLEEYDLFNKLSASVINIAYCCNLNHCYS